MYPESYRDGALETLRHGSTSSPTKLSASFFDRNFSIFTGPYWARISFL